MRRCFLLATISFLAGGTACVGGDASIGGESVALSAGSIDTFAGGTAIADGQLAATAVLVGATRMARHAGGDLYVTEAADNRVLRIDADARTITTIAGTGAYGYSGDGGDAAGARFAAPAGLDVDAAGRVYVADGGDDRVRRIDPDGTVHTLAGDGSHTTSGDGGPATAAGVPYPRDVAVDRHSNVYIAQGGRVRRVDATTGTIETVVLTTDTVGSLSPTTSWPGGGASGASAT